MENKQMPELKDIIQSIRRYNITHKDGVFIFSVVGFKKEPNDECGDYDDAKSIQGAYGSIKELRILVNELRDVIEDDVDEDGFVNI